MEGTNNTTISVVQSFGETFESGNLVETLAKIGEVGLDYALELAIDAPILKDIPVLGVLVSGTKTVASIRSHVLVKKVLCFFYGIKDVSIEKRRKFAEEYCQTNREDTAEALLSILDRINNRNNVPIICRLMKAEMDDKISMNDFNRCILALERISFTDLECLLKFDNDYYEEGVAESFESAGLVYLSVIDSHNRYDGPKMSLSRTGRLLLVYGMEKMVPLDVPRTTRIKSDFG